MNAVSRRRYLATVAGATAAGIAGCTIEYNGPAGPNVGSLPSGEPPTLQDITRDQADVEVTTADALIDHAARGDGRIIWIPADAEIDLTGRDLVIRGTTVASGRNANQSGAVITTSDQGASSPAWNGGSGTGLIRIEENGRLTGVIVRGPHTDVTDHPALSGYFPFAPGGASARERWRRERFARGIAIVGSNVKVDNCEIAYFSVQGICVGSEGAVSNVTVAYCHIHNTCMTSYGYCVDVRHGDCTVYRCYLDAARHAICGSGYADANYTILETTIGPWQISHPLDMHRVGNNVSGSSDPNAVDYRRRAGGTMIVRGCNIMPTRVPDLEFINRLRGDQIPHASIRGLPLDGLYFENNRCAHDGVSSGINQSGLPGSAETDENGFARIYVSGNEWGVDFSEDAPQPQQQPQQPQQPSQTQGTDGAWIHEGFENGADNIIQHPDDPGTYMPDHPDALRIDDTFARTGQRSMKLTVDYGWDYPVRRGSNKPIPNGRDEMQNQGYSVWGEPIWFSFSLGLPPDWQPDGIIEQVMEFHRAPEDNPGSTHQERTEWAGNRSGKPITTIIDGRELQFRNDWTENGQPQESWITAPNVTLQAGQWHDIVMNLKWVKEGQDDTGFVRIWVNDQQVMDHTGNTTARDVLPPRPPELRIYKWPWDSNDVDNTRRSVNFDEVRWGFADAEYSDMVPGQR